ncbi:MAG: hypothetical protein HY360_05635 [Verrucomicrobia bacterium]|nr:hypothetical protein [Verrucomicrobiota bacterium]
MSTLEEIEKAIEKLPPEEFSKFSMWFDVHRDDEWDRQIRADAMAGRLDKLLAQVDYDMDAGRLTNFPGAK